MKKILFVFQVLMLSAVTCAQVQIDGIYYNLNVEEKTAEVTNGTLWGYEDDLVIPEIVTSDGVDYRVTRVGHAAFSGSKSTSITLPASITSIGEYAFAGCSFLTSVNIPDGVTAIEEYTFADCSALQSLTLPNSVKSLGEWVFDTCTSLTSLDLGEGLETIGYRAFMRCRALKFLILPSSLTSIAEKAFEMCTPTLMISKNPTPPTLPWMVFDNRETLLLKVPPGCAEAYRKAREWSNLTHVEEYDPYHEIINLEGIDYELFYSNRTAQVASKNKTIGGDVVIPDTAIYSRVGFRVTEVSSWAFSTNKNITSVTIPSSVTSLGQNAFYRCTSLTSVTLSNGLKSLDYYAIGFCENLTSINIPATVTDINQWAFHATPLSSISVDEENSVYDSRDNCNAVIRTATNSVYIGTKNTVIPKGVTEIELCAFYYTPGLTSITIPEGVKKIGGSAFINCPDLTDVSLPYTMTSIEDCAFQFCEKLKTVTSLNPIPPTIQEYTFMNRNHILRVPYGCKEAYENAEYWKDCFYLIEEMEPSGVQEIYSDKDLNTPIFDLSGRRLSKLPTQGVYIRDGKKVVVK